ncbi:hypothetical protein QU873_28595, partial [Escherichia coli]|nr:hypothetical protein [Escherichia coli]
MGKYIRPLSDAVFTIASDDLWIESLAIQQLHTTANLPNMQRVVLMNPLMIFIKIIKLRWIHILSYDQM